MGNNEKSLEITLECLKIKKEAYPCPDSDPFMINTYKELFDLYTLLGDDENALIYSKLSGGSTEEIEGSPLNYSSAASSSRRFAVN